MKHLVSCITLSIAIAACGSVTNHLPGADGGGDDDAVVPAVVSTDPANGAAGVHANAAITIVFSEPMDRASVETAWESVDLPAAAVSFAWNDPSDTVVVTPATPLELAEGKGIDPSVVAARAYTVGVAATAATPDGRTLDHALALDFTTQRRMTIACTPITSLTRSLRSDGFVFVDTTTSLIAGDTINTNLQVKSFASFELPVLPAGAVVEAAALGANQTTIVRNPYVLGKLIALHVVAPVIDATAFSSAPLGSARTLSSTAAIGVKTLDVTDDVAADVGTRSSSQFRLEFEQPTNGDANDDEAQLSRRAMTLDLTYLVD